MGALMRAITIGVVLGAVPACVAAQGRVDFTPFVGLYLPTADLFEIRDFLVAGDKVTGKQKTTAVFGGRLGVWATNRIAFEGSFGYAPSKGEATYTDPSNVSSSSDSSGHVILASGRILVRFGSTGGNTSWHLIFGGGCVEVPRGEPDVPAEVDDRPGGNRVLPIEWGGAGRDLSASLRVAG